MTIDANKNQAIDEVAVLAEPVRRRLYEFVATAAEGAGRDAAAAGVGINRALAAFHLDRLVAAGFLEVTFRHLGQRRGPGAGRPAKIYRRSDRELMVSVPQRSYDVAAELLATALDSAGTEDADKPRLAELAAAAHRLGASIGEEARRRAGPRPSRKRLQVAAMDVLAGRGYEPRMDDSGGLILGNCPFDALARRHRSLVCGMNLSIMRGVLDGLRERGVIATLDPQEGRCCVILEQRPR
ncbi:MAG: transcriptional regulator [Chloroflexota bacterium]|nr:MAG: transcriptional regulator [Chloroflexota bacterium]